MAAYIIVQANITDKEKYKEYLNKVTSIVEKYSGEYLVRGGKYEKMLGNWDYERTVVIKFPSFIVINFSKNLIYNFNFNGIL